MVNKFSVDFEALEERLKPQAPVFKYAAVKDRLVKVAFDVVRFMDTDNIDGLWQIQKTDDGEVIVAMYDGSLPEEPQTKTASRSEWSTIADGAGYINVFYKESPVTKVSLASLGMADENPVSVSKTLSEKLASNDKLRNSFLGSLNQQERAALFSAHPELKG